MIHGDTGRCVKLIQAGTLETVERLNLSNKRPVFDQQEVNNNFRWACSKAIHHGRSLCDEPSARSVREHGAMTTCLDEAAPGLRSQSYFGGVGSGKHGTASLSAVALAACAPKLASAASAKAGGLLNSLTVKLRLFRWRFLKKEKEKEHGTLLFTKNRVPCIAIADLP